MFYNTNIATLEASCIRNTLIFHVLFHDWDLVDELIFTDFHLIEAELHLMILTFIRDIKCVLNMDRIIRSTRFFTNRDRLNIAHRQLRWDITSKGGPIILLLQELLKLHNLFVFLKELIT